MSATSTAPHDQTLKVSPVSPHPTHPPLHQPPTMCEATYFKSSTCRCRWLSITRPCSYGMGFDYHPYHQGVRDKRNVLGMPDWTLAPAHSCPQCNGSGPYSSNVTRMWLGNSSRGCAARAYPATGLDGGWWYGNGMDYGWNAAYGRRYYRREPECGCTVM